MEFEVKNGNSQISSDFNSFHLNFISHSMLDVNFLLENGELRTRFQTFNQRFSSFLYCFNICLQIISLHIDVFSGIPNMFKTERAMTDISESVKKTNRLLLNFEASNQQKKMAISAYAGIEDAIFAFKDQKNDNEKCIGIQK